MITDKLLISTEYIKEHTTISDNLNDEYLIPCLIDCQLSHLQPLIGTALYDKLFDEDINEDYKFLIDNYISQFLIMAVQSELCISNFAKEHNAANVSYIDTNYQAKTLQELKFLRDYYAAKEEFYAKRITEYLCANASKFKEWKNCRDAADMHAKDCSSTYFCGINLSGVQQKKRLDK